MSQDSALPTEPGTDTNPAPAASRSRVQRVRHELRRRQLQVLRVQTLSPHFRRVVLGGPELAGFVSASFDDHVKLFFPQPGGEVVMRDYTPRHHDAAAGELHIDFALHGAGPAAEWALQASPGQTLTVGGPRGSFIVPTDYAWHLLVGDDTALPAIERRLAELPATTQALVVLQLNDTADRRALNSAASMQAHEVADAAALLDTLRRLPLPTGEGYAWCAGEATTMAQVRAVLVDERGHDRHALRAAAYWKRGAAGHHENLAA